MNIAQLIVKNIRQGPVTLRFPARVPVPDHLRGRVVLASEQCIGCGTCAYVCAPGAIRVSDRQVLCEWEYDPGACTFCGRCADYCPSRALVLESDRPPVYVQAGALKQLHQIAYPRCPLCGQPAHPIAEWVLTRAFDEVGEPVRTWSHWCDQCRQRRDPLATLWMVDHGA